MVMKAQRDDFAEELREKIAEYPQRSFALAALGGFAIGGGLSNRTTFQIILLVLQGLLGDRLIPAIVSKTMTDNNGRRPRHKR
jgi:hypothetical protein